MTVLIRRSFARYGVYVLCLSTLMLAGGCEKSTAKVSGKVTLDGQPLKGGGTVTFEGAEGGVSAIITPEGTYALPNAPVGKVTITLGSGMSKSVGAGAVPGGPPPKGAPKKLFTPARPLNNIPMKYSDPKTSELIYTVKPGEQTFDLALRGL